jgi:AAHS family benzoate transporter-like MFS transporter
MRHIDLHQLADDARFNGFHRKVLFWCALIIIFDGYDLAVAGIALPSIMKEMGVSPSNAGFMVSSALFGMMFGAIFLGTIADKIGRRWAIAICIGLFSIFTAAAGFTHDPYAFSVMRFLAGLGIGGVMPNVVAQMTEYSPRRIRSTMVTSMFSGYAVGGMLAALIGKGMIEAYGWSSVFIAAGLPVLLIPFILKSMPESMPFLIRSNRLDQRVLAISEGIAQVAKVGVQRAVSVRNVPFEFADVASAPRASIASPQRVLSLYRSARKLRSLFGLGVRQPDSILRGK